MAGRTDNMSGAAWQWFGAGGFQARSAPGYSCCAWFNILSSPGTTFSAIMSKDNATLFPMRLGILGNGVLSGGIQGSICALGNAPSTAFAVTSAAIVAGSWYFACAAFQGSTVNLYPWKFANNTMNSMAIGGTGAAALDADSGPFSTFLANTSSFARPFAGTVFGYAVWAACLTQQEAQAMAWGAKPYSIRPASFVGYVPIDLGTSQAGASVPMAQGGPTGTTTPVTEPAEEILISVPNPPITGVQSLTGLGRRMGPSTMDQLPSCTQVGFKGPMFMLPSMLSAPPGPVSLFMPNMPMMGR